MCAHAPPARGSLGVCVTVCICVCVCARTNREAHWHIGIISLHLQLLLARCVLVGGYVRVCVCQPGCV